MAYHGNKWSQNSQSPYNWPGDLYYLFLFLYRVLLNSQQSNPPAPTACNLLPHPLSPSFLTLPCNPPPPRAPQPPPPLVDTARPRVRTGRTPSKPLNTTTPLISMPYISTTRRRAYMMMPYLASRCRTLSYDIFFMRRRRREYRLSFKQFYPLFFNQPRPPVFLAPNLIA